MSKAKHEAFKQFLEQPEYIQELQRISLMGGKYTSIGTRKQPFILKFFDFGMNWDQVREFMNTRDIYLLDYLRRTAGLALILDGPIVAIDFDGPSARHWLAARISPESMQSMNDTLGFTSGRIGREQRLFLRPTGVELSRKPCPTGTIGDDGKPELLEFRAGRCVSNLPPSAHPTSPDGYYRWLNAGVEILPLPPDVLQLWTTLAPPRPQAPPPQLRRSPAPATETSAKEKAIREALSLIAQHSPTPEEQVWFDLCCSVETELGAGAVETVMSTTIGEKEPGEYGRSFAYPGKTLGTIFHYARLADRRDADRIIDRYHNTPRQTKRAAEEDQCSRGVEARRASRT